MSDPERGAAPLECCTEESELSADDFIEASEEFAETGPAISAKPRPWLTLLERPRVFWALFGACLVVNLLPLCMARYLPFTDLQGAAGLLGAMDRAGDPEARIHEFFKFQIHAFPNIIFWAVGWVFSRVMPVTAASNLYVAIFCIAGPALALLYALRSFGKPAWLAFFAFPALYHRGIWFGFMGSVPAVGMLLFALGLANQTFERPRASWRDLALALTLLVLATAHAFLFLVGAGLVFLWALLAIGRPSPAWRRFAVLVPGLVYLGPWLRGVVGRTGSAPGQPSLLRYFWSQRLSPGRYLSDVHQWFINGYAGHLDEVVAAVFAVSLVLLLVLGVRDDRDAGVAAALATKPAGRLWRARLAVARGVFGAGYILLPMSIMRPFYWWAVNVRLLMPFVFTLVLIVPRRRRGLPSWTVLPVALAGLFWGAFLTYDFRVWWRAVEIDGLHEALASIPKGRKVHAIYPAFEAEAHYSHFSMAHIVDYYIVERGGLATPLMDGHPKDLWVVPNPPPPRAGWGMGRAFNWEKHGRYWDYFLVKAPAPGNGGASPLFAGAPSGAVTKVFEKGLWSVWKGTPPAPASPLLPPALPRPR